MAIFKRVFIMIKTLIVINFILILISLGSGMFFLTRDQGRGNRVVTSLTVRVALSVSLFTLIIVAYSMGLIQPHGLNG